MIDAPNDVPEEFAPTREHEYQDSHYHDEEPDIVNDDGTPVMSKLPAARKKANRRPPPPKPWHDED
jgi:hypothetical protein